MLRKILQYLRCGFKVQTRQLRHQFNANATITHIDIHVNGKYYVVARGKDKTMGAKEPQEFAGLSKYDKASETFVFCNPTRRATRDLSIFNTKINPIRDTFSFGGNSVNFLRKYPFSNRSRPDISHFFRISWAFSSFFLKSLLFVQIY